MTAETSPSYTLFDRLSNVFYRAASSGILPPSWFRPRMPAEAERGAVDGKLKLEIVSHCWNYSHLLAYQLSSFCLYPPTRAAIVVTVYYCAEDKGTEKQLAYFAEQKVDNVSWNWQPLSKVELFRRSIGRNRAALSTQADWIWFTDCDIIFREGCLDGLADSVQGRKDKMLYPLFEHVTSMLDDDNPLLQKGAEPHVVDITESDFHKNQLDKAKGAYQIVHGDVARAIGYCKNIRLYQKPTDAWRKTYEDKAFRWMMQTRGEAVDIPNVYQIRHITKGRYKKDSVVSDVRSKIRQLQE